MGGVAELSPEGGHRHVEDFGWAIPFLSKTSLMSGEQIEVPGRPREPAALADVGLMRYPKFPRCGLEGAALRDEGAEERVFAA